MLDHCRTCKMPFDISVKPSPMSRVPTALPCGHVMCSMCARRPTLTPATSMSVCSTCHVPYTRRDIYALDLSQYIDSNDRKYRALGFPTDKAQANAIVPRVTTGASGSNTSSESTGSSDEAYGMTVPALLQRIRDLEAAVGHRDGQIQEWRKQVDKNAQAIMVYLRELRELKQEVMDWWRRSQDKDLEVQALRRALQDKPPAKVQSPPLSPSHRRELDGARVVTRAKIGSVPKRGVILPS